MKQKKIAKKNKIELNEFKTQENELKKFELDKNIKIRLIEFNGKNMQI